MTQNPNYENYTGNYVNPNRVAMDANAGKPPPPEQIPYGYYWDAVEKRLVQQGSYAGNKTIPSSSSTPSTATEKNLYNTGKANTGGSPVYFNGQPVYTPPPSWYKGKFQNYGVITTEEGAQIAPSRAGEEWYSTRGQDFAVYTSVNTGATKVYDRTKGEMIDVVMFPSRFEGQSVAGLARGNELYRINETQSSWSLIPAVQTGMMPASPEGTGWTETPWVQDAKDASLWDTGVNEILYQRHVEEASAITAGMTMRQYKPTYGELARGEFDMSLTNVFGVPPTPLTTGAKMRVVQWNVSEVNRVYGEGVAAIPWVEAHATPESATAFKQSVEGLRTQSTVYGVKAADYAAGLGAYEFQMKQIELDKSVFSGQEAWLEKQLEVDKTTQWGKGAWVNEAGKGLAVGAIVGVPKAVEGIAHWAVDISPLGSFEAAVPQLKSGDYLGAFSTYTFHPIKKGVETVMPLVVFTAGAELGAYQLATGDVAGASTGFANFSTGLGLAFSNMFGTPYRAGYTYGTIAMGTYYGMVMTPPPKGYEGGLKTEFRKWGTEQTSEATLGREFGVVKQTYYHPRFVWESGGTGAVGETVVKRIFGGEFISKETMLGFPEYTQVGKAGWKFGSPSTMEGVANYLSKGQSPFSLKFKEAGVSTMTHYEPAVVEQVKGWAYAPETNTWYNLRGGAIAEPLRDYAGYMTPSKMILPSRGQEFMSLGSELSEGGSYSFTQAFGRVRDLNRWYDPVRDQMYTQVAGTGFTVMPKGKFGQYTFLGDVYEGLPVKQLPYATSGEYVSTGSIFGIRDVGVGARGEFASFLPTGTGSGIQVFGGSAQRGFGGWAGGLAAERTLFENVFRSVPATPVHASSLALEAIKTIPANPITYSPTGAVGFGFAAASTRLVANPPSPLTRTYDFQKYNRVPFTSFRPVGLTLQRNPVALLNPERPAQATKQPATTIFKEPVLVIPRQPEMTIPREAPITLPREVPVVIPKTPVVVIPREPVVPPFAPVITVPETPPYIPKMPPTFGFGGGGGGRQYSTFKLNVPKRSYKPSIVATEFGIKMPKGKALKVSAASGGMGIRPLVGGGSKRRRKTGVMR